LFQTIGNTIFSTTVLIKSWQVTLEELLSPWLTLSCITSMGYFLCTRTKVAVEQLKAAKDMGGALVFRLSFDRKSVMSMRNESNKQQDPVFADNVFHRRATDNTKLRTSLCIRKDNTALQFFRNHVTNKIR
jgi:hypothetical protein